MIVQQYLYKIPRDQKSTMTRKHCFGYVSPRRGRISAEFIRRTRSLFLSQKLLCARSGKRLGQLSDKHLLSKERTYFYFYILASGLFLFNSAFFSPSTTDKETMNFFLTFYGYRLYEYTQLHIALVNSFLGQCC